VITSKKDATVIYDRVRRVSVVSAVIGLCEWGRYVATGAG